MSDVRLVGTSPEDGSLVPVAVTPAGLLKTQVGTIEEIPNSLIIDGDLTVNGTINGEEPGGGGGSALPDGARDGQVLATVGGELTWIDPPGGLPEPLGEEGQIIQVLESEPAWVTNSSVPPWTPYQIKLLTGETSSNGKKGMFAPDGTIAPGVQDWDAYARSQSFWNTLQSTTAGACEKDVLVTSFDFQLTNQPGVVIELGVAAYVYNAGVYTEIPLSVSASNPNLTPIVDTVTFPANSIGNTGGYGTVSFLATRPNLGLVQLNIAAGAPASVYNDGCFVGFQNWRAVDSGSFAVQQQINVSKKLDDIANAFKGLYEGGSTTDIDLLRSS